MVPSQRDREDTRRVTSPFCPVQVFYCRHTSIGLVLTTLKEGGSPSSSFFSRQLWTADGPDGRHGRCVGATARTREGDRATSRHPATAVDLARAGTSMWRIAPVACATVSHRQTFLRLDCVLRSSQSFCVPQSSDENHCTTILRISFKLRICSSFSRNVKLSTIYVFKLLKITVVSSKYDFILGDYIVSLII